LRWRMSRIGCHCQNLQVVIKWGPTSRYTHLLSDKRQQALPTG
jgi:hypothetical protein